MAAEQTLSGLTDEALTHQLFNIERDLVRARFAHSMGQLENTAALRVMRKQIARIKTEARKREVDQGMGKDALIRSHRSTFKADSAGETEASAEQGGGFLQGIVDKLTTND